MNAFYEFNEFRLDAENSSLWRDGRLVPINPKALDVLVLLVRKHGSVVSREELLETVWNETFVEESNITYTVSLLRKTLGTNDDGDFIQTVPKRGYRFVADVRENLVPPNGSADTSLPTVRSERHGNQSETKVRWHFIAIVLLGLFFVSSFALWLNLDAKGGIDETSVIGRDIRTLAVLPPRTLPDSEHANALSLALADALISRLGGLNRFTVRPLSSVQDYSSTKQDPIAFGRAVEVDVVLEGTLQTIDNRVRVNLRLWDVRDGAQLWQGSFDETDGDYFLLQDLISTRVSQSLVSGLLEKDSAPVLKRDTENQDALQAYWRGRFFWENSKPEKAIAEFKAAIELDPKYALAYAGLADAYSQKAQFAGGNAAEIYESARRAAKYANAIAPGLSDAHVSLGRIELWYDWDWPGAQRSFERAIELDRSNVRAYELSSRIHSILGEYDRAQAAIQRARELDPRSSELTVRLLAILERRGDLLEAAKIAEKLMESDKKALSSSKALGSVSLLKGDYARVIQLGNERFPGLVNTNYFWASLLATAYDKSGQQKKAAEMVSHLKDLARSDPKALYFLAATESERGHSDQAFAALQACLEIRDEQMIWTKGEPRFALIKNDPRFSEILRKMRLN